jgi:hypothetical protein
MFSTSSRVDKSALTRQFDYGLGLGSNFSSAFNATHYDNIANALWQSDTVAIIDFEGFKEKTTAKEKKNKSLTHKLASFSLITFFCNLGKVCCHFLFMPAFSAIH